MEINADTPPADADGLELWGSETSDLANKFPLAGDPAGQAVVNWDAINGFGTTDLSKFDIVAAIGIPDLGGLVDVDALMDGMG